MKKIFLLLLATGTLAYAELWPGSTPVVKQQPDGTVVLNAEAAAFVMNDRMGQHVMNESAPKLKIVDGRVTNLGEDAQLPAWRFRLAHAGKYEVYLYADNSAVEDCVIRVSFYQDKREFRVVAPVEKGKASPVFLGVTGFPEDTVDAFLMLSGVTSNQHLPQVQEIRLVPVSNADLDAVFNRPWVRNTLSGNDAVRQAEQAAAVASAALAQARKDWNAKQDLSLLATYDDLLRWDRNRDIVTNGPERLTVLNQALRDARWQALKGLTGKIPEEDRAAIDAWKNDQQVQANRLTGTYPKVLFPSSARPVEPTLFPVGNLDKMAPPPVSDGGEVFVFNASKRPDEAARLAIFEARNSPKVLAVLAQYLLAALRPNMPGLEAFYEACKAGKNEEALDAYRDYFFRKLKESEKYGAPDLDLTDDFFQRDGKAYYLRAPYPDRVKKNMAGIAVYVGNNVWVEGRVGAPGSVDWAPVGLQPPTGVTFGRVADGSPFWKTESGKSLTKEILFYRALNRLPTVDASTALFPDLLFSYCFTGNTAHLGRFAEYVDDWSMNSTRDIDNCTVNIRAATELQVLSKFRGLMRVILDERPEFAHDFPAPTLARYLLTLTEVFHPYVVRAKRAEIANWGIMGVEHGLKDTLHFNEFRSMDAMNREFVRLARINWIQHLSLDGENLESWDEGHMGIDNALKTTASLTWQSAPVMGDLEARSFLDTIKTGQRATMTHFSSEGNYWVSWFPNEDPNRSTIRGKLIPRNYIDRIMDEPEVRSRFFAALRGTPADRTMPTSDFEPYSQAAYLRDGFGEKSTSLFFQNFPVRSQNQGWGFNSKRGHVVGSLRTQFNVARDGISVLEASPLIVDSKAPNFFTDLTPSGGKTDYSFQTPRHVQPGRFLSSADFDVVEGVQDSPYSRTNLMPGRDRGELLGLSQATPDVPLRDIRAVREIFHLRSEGIFVIGDRLRNPGGERELAQMFAVPLRVTGPAELDRLRLLAKQNAVLVELDPKIPRVRTLSPGLPNVSLYLAGHDFTFGGRSTGETGFEPVGSITAQNFFDRVKAGKSPEKAMAADIPTILSARWKGREDQSLATLVVARSGVDSPGEAGAGDVSNFVTMNGPGGVAGFSCRTAQGTRIWFQIAPTLGANLAAGPASARAGALLVAQREGVITGVVMDGDVVSIGGKTFSGPGGAFQFTLKKDGTFTTLPVLTPIDTTIISPEQTVFIDKVSVSFAIPTQNRTDLEFRYTLDGTDPQIDSALYTKPFDLTTDTLVKVRPFRKGLKSTPWNIAGVEGGKTISAIYRKMDPLPALKTAPGKPGLRYAYFEDSWLVLMSHSGMYPLLKPKATGEAQRLLDPVELARIRQTDRAYAVKYAGAIEVPATGVYRFFAPEPLYNTTLDAGYDLRIWIDGQEWFPNPELHAENIWSIALEKGRHHFAVSYVDYRWKTFRNEYWMGWNPQQMWTGIPLLELDGPGLKKQSLPASWLSQ
jgi:hypothetical protein